MEIRILKCPFSDISIIYILYGHLPQIVSYVFTIQILTNLGSRHKL